VRAKASEMILAASTCRTSITEAVQTASSIDVSGTLPNVCGTTSSKYVTSRSVSANGVITVVGDFGALGGDTSVTANAITLIPITGTTALVGTTDGGDTITSWTCGPAVGANPMPAKYLPGSCQG
jgi:type IV pilus assembly protein PilA